MKKALLLLVAAASLGGCAYTSPAIASGDKVVLPKNDGFLFGAMRTVYVCKATDSGLTNCRTAESP